MMLRWRTAGSADAKLLAAMNQRLIQDERHRNPMRLPELEDRMKGWLDGEYQAVIFEDESRPLAYALFHFPEDFLYLRQFFVERDVRRRGIGRAAIRLLLGEVWPRDKKIVVTALSHNESAIAFWRAVGFSDYCLSLEILPEDRK